LKLKSRNEGKGGFIIIDWKLEDDLRRTCEGMPLENEILNDGEELLEKTTMRLMKLSITDVSIEILVNVSVKKWSE
jgi:hypothetical protein